MSQHRAPRSRFRRRSAIAVSALAVLGGAVAVWLPSASADQTAGARPNAKVQRSLDDLVRGNGFPAALASVRDEKGHTRDYTA
ncbi:serine hydrolase, partial [Streptomyces coelicoflavus]